VLDYLLLFAGISVLIFNTLYWQVVRPARKAARAAAAQVAVKTTGPPCIHADAVPVESVTGETVAWLCPACDRQLDAEWKPGWPSGSVQIAVSNSPGAQVNVGNGNSITWTVAGDRQPLAMTGGAGGSSMVNLDALHQQAIDDQSERIQRAVLGDFMTLDEAREVLAPWQRRWL
jgi:hypothetical protein